MHHTPKQDFMGCGIATAAMIAGTTYEEASVRAIDLEPAALRHTRQLLRLLEGLTEVQWQEAWGPWPQPVSEMAFPDWPVAALLQDCRSRPRFQQWIAVKRPVIHDPSLATCVSVKHYRYKHWFVGRMLEPVSPAQLLARRPHDRARFVLHELAVQMNQDRHHVCRAADTTETEGSPE